MSHEYAMSHELLEQADSLISAIKKLCGDLQQKNAELADSAIVPKRYEERSNSINLLTGVSKRICQANSCLTTTLAKLKQIHQKESQLLTNLLSGVTKPPEVEWEVVSSANKGGGKMQNAPTKSTLVQSASPQNTITYSPRVIQIKITTNLSLEARLAQSFAEVQRDGNLYFIQPNNHFAIYICGTLFHGNIGQVFTKDRNPERIKECRYGTSCVRGQVCNYYHNPMENNSSADVRNYIASAWIYSPPSCEFRSPDIVRRFGSKDTLDIDIIGITGGEVARFCDQTMHDILCSLLLCKYGKK
jgi:hypothetical protein